MYCWSIEAGGWLGIGNDPRLSAYESRTFEPYAISRSLAGRNLRCPQISLRKVGERLELRNFATQRLAEHDFLTMTCALQCAGAGAGAGQRLRCAAAFGEGAGYPRGRAGLGAEGNPRRHRPRRLRGLRLGRPGPGAGRQAGRDRCLRRTRRRSRRKRKTSCSPASWR